MQAVVVTVQRDSVSLPLYPLQQLRAFDHLLADYKKGRAGAVAGEDLKHRRGSFGMWTVVEGDRHATPVSGARILLGRGKLGQSARHAEGVREGCVDGGEDVADHRKPAGGPTVFSLCANFGTKRRFPPATGLTWHRCLSSLMTR